MFDVLRMRAPPIGCLHVTSDDPARLMAGALAAAESGDPAARDALFTALSGELHQSLHED